MMTPEQIAEDLNRLFAGNGDAQVQLREALSLWLQNSPSESDSPVKILDDALSFLKSRCPNVRIGKAASVRVKLDPEFAAEIERRKQVRAKKRKPNGARDGDRKPSSAEADEGSGGVVEGTDESNDVFMGGEV